MEVMSKAIAEEINTTLKNECMACYDPTVQVHEQPTGKSRRP